MMISLFLLKIKQQNEAGVELKEVTIEKSMIPSPVNYSFSCVKGLTGFDVLVQNARVEAENNEGDRRIVGINSQSEGGGRFWIFAVDGVESSMSAQMYNCRDTEILSWTLR